VSESKLFMNLQWLNNLHSRLVFRSLLVLFLAPMPIIIIIIGNEELNSLSKINEARNQHESRWHAGFLFGLFFSTLKMGTTFSFEILAIRHCISEDRTLYNYCHKNVKSYINYVICIFSSPFVGAVA
jgi:hypothetical protein